QAQANLLRKICSSQRSSSRSNHAGTKPDTAKWTATRPREPIRGDGREAEPQRLLRAAAADRLNGPYLEAVEKACLEPNNVPDDQAAIGGKPLDRPSYSNNLERLAVQLLRAHRVRSTHNREDDDWNSGVLVYEGSRSFTLSLTGSYHDRKSK